MKFFRLIGRSIRDAFKSVIRNFSLSLASISCITITLIIIGSTLIIAKNVDNFATLIKEDVTVVTFFDNSLTKEQEEEIITKIKAIENVDVSSCEYTSKQDIKNKMESEKNEISKILSTWNDSENPLMDTYTLKVKDINDIKKTVSEIENIKGVESVSYGEGIVEQLVKAFDKVEKITLVVGLALILVTIFLIINTIKLTIFSRQKEISIMRLVGASNSRIKFPFIIEGVILGIIGSIIPVLTMTYGYQALYQSLKGQLFSPIIRLVHPMPFTIQISLLIVLVGMLVGMIGSARAVRRYIKI